MAFLQDNADTSISLDILLVDSNDKDRAHSFQVMQSLGHRVDEAKSGNEAINAIYKRDYDVVFMELKLSDLDGFTTTRLIRILPIHNQIPIIALTNNTIPERVRSCFLKGMNNYIPKPLTEDHLHAAISSYEFKKKSNIAHKS